MMKTIDDLAVEGRRVLVRADLNVPLDGGRVADDGRIRASLPTLTALNTRGARVVVCAHLGRPGGKPDPKYSLAPVAARLSELLGEKVEFAADTTGPSARAARTWTSPVSPGSRSRSRPRWGQRSGAAASTSRARSRYAPPRPPARASTPGSSSW